MNWITDQTRLAEGSKRADSLPVGSHAETVTAVDRDGRHGFDPLIGSWKYRLERLLHPLAGSTTWVEYRGTGFCRKVWAGRAELDEAVFDGPSDHIEGPVLRLYNPQSHQWRLYWANSRNGIIDPPQIGEFKNGRGEFFAQDTINSKSVFIRFEWSRMTSDSPSLSLFALLHILVAAVSVENHISLEFLHHLPPEVDDFGSWMAEIAIATSVIVIGVTDGVWLSDALVGLYRPSYPLV